MPNADGGHGFMYGYKNLLDLGLGLEKLFLEKKKPCETLYEGEPPYHIAF